MVQSLLEKIPVVQEVKIVLAFYGIRQFIIIFSQQELNVRLFSNAIKWRLWRYENQKLSAVLPCVCITDSYMEIHDKYINFSTHNESGTANYFGLAGWPRALQRNVLRIISCKSLADSQSSSIRVPVSVNINSSSEKKTQIYKKSTLISANINSLFLMLGTSRCKY